MSNLTNYERETIILFNEAEDVAKCYTCNKALIKRLDSFCLKSQAIVVKKEDTYSKTYLFPKKWVRVQLPPMLTEEQRTKMAIRARERFHK